MLNKLTALDLTFQALADPTRRAILAELTRGPRSVSKLARPLQQFDRLGEYLNNRGKGEGTYAKDK
jgi:hypothetical protein